MITGCSSRVIIFNDEKTIQNIFWTGSLKQWSIMGKVDACFTFFSRGARRTAALVILNLVLSILLIVLSAVQSFAICTFDNESYCDAYSDSCKDYAIIHYISPYHVKGGSFDHGCPWRVRNTVLRALITSFMVIASILALVALFRSKFKWIWPAVYWMHWLLFVLMFVVFVLDADAVNSGYSSCQRYRHSISLFLTSES